MVMRLGPSQLMQLWVLPSASFVCFLLLSPRGALGSSSQGHHYTAKGNRARPPGGCRVVVLCDLAFCEIMRVGAGSTVCDRSRQRSLSCVFF